MVSIESGGASPGEAHERAAEPAPRLGVDALGESSLACGGNSWEGGSWTSWTRMRV